MSNPIDKPNPVKKINWKGQIQKVNVKLSETTKKKITLSTKEKNDDKSNRTKG